MPTTTSNRRAGQTLIVFTLALIPLMGITGLVVDIGWAYFRREAAQTASDAAASAAAIAASAAVPGATPTCLSSGVACYATPYTCPSSIAAPPANNILAGCMYAISNGFTSTGRQTVTFLSGVGNPPGGGGANVGYYAVARVKEDIPQLFSAALGFPTATVAAESTGAVTIGAAACIYVLSSSASPALSVTGSSSITTTQCAIYVNSSGAAALSVSGSSHVTSTAININGAGVSITGSSGTNPAPNLNAGPVTDPLAALGAPAYSGCDKTNYSLGNGKTATLNPGVYCGGINVSGAATVTLTSGVYVLNGGGLTVSNGGTLNGSNVMFYNTGTPTTYPIAPFNITGSGVANLTAPSSGTYQGITVFQDRTLTYAAPNSISNSGTGNITGTLYFPTTEFDFTGNTASAMYAAFIANTIKVTGSSTLKNDATGTYTGLANRSGSGSPKPILIY